MALFLKIIEWKDSDGSEIVHKVAVDGRDINSGSKIVVRPSQMAVFVHKGQIADVFKEGTYALNTEILPVLSKLEGWAYGFKTPTTVDLYFVSLRQFTDIKWGTANPVILRDPDFGMIRVTGYGAFSFRVGDCVKFLRELFGTKSSFTAADIAGYLKKIVLSGLSDALGESGLSVLDLAAHILELQEKAKDAVGGKFAAMGLTLGDLVIENISVPQEVQKAIDERAKYGIVGDKTDVMMKVAAAEAMKAAASNPGTGANFVGAGMGIGMGAEFGRAMGEALRPSGKEVKEEVPRGGAFCPHCGASLPPNAKFCGECGSKLAEESVCPKCGHKLSGKSKFCPECGAKL